MQKRKIWCLAVIVFWIAFYRFTASPLSNGEHTLLLLHKLSFLSNHEIILLSKIVRKAAHFSVFAIMAIFLRNAIAPHRWSYPAAWILATLYGASDEIHQIYVISRTPLFSDVIIDSLGAAAGLIIIYMWQRKHMPKSLAPDLHSKQSIIP